MNRDNQNILFGSFPETLVWNRQLTPRDLEEISEKALLNESPPPPTKMDLSSQVIQEWNLPMINLDHSNFSGAHIINSVFSYPDLDLAPSFRHTIFKDAFFEKSHFSFADLSAADLSGAFVKESFFRRSNLSESSLKNAKLKKADFSSAILKDSSLDYLEADGSIFKNATFKDDTVFLGVSFINSLFGYTDNGSWNGFIFLNAKLLNNHFQKTLFQDCRFDTVDISSSHFALVDIDGGSSFLESSLSGATFEESKVRALFQECDLSRAVFSNCEIKNTLFVNCCIDQADFSTSRLCDSQFIGTDIKTATF